MGNSPGERLVYLWEPGTDLGSSLIFTGHTRTSFTNSTSEFSTQLTASRTFRPFGPLSPNICLKAWLPVTATRFAMINSIVDTIFVTVSLAISNTATATNRTLFPDIKRVHFFDFKLCQETTNGTWVSNYDWVSYKKRHFAVNQ